jgi:hypothetical protein
MCPLTCKHTNPSIPPKTWLGPGILDEYTGLHSAFITCWVQNVEPKSNTFWLWGLLSWWKSLTSTSSHVEFYNSCQTFISSREEVLRPQEVGESHTGRANILLGPPILRVFESRYLLCLKVKTVGRHHSSCPEYKHLGIWGRGWQWVQGPCEPYSDFFFR